MPSQTFDALKYQFNDQWDTICKANQPDRRVLMVQLAEVLANWEQQQSEPLDKIQTLKRMGHWKAIAENSAAQLEQIIATLDENKTGLRDKLHMLKKQLDEHLQHLTIQENETRQLEEHLEPLKSQVGVNNASEAALAQKNDHLKQQLETLKKLSSLQHEIKQANGTLTLLEESLQQGRDPSGLLDVLKRLFTQREQLLAYYQSYVTANQNIQKNLAPLGHNPRLGKIEDLLTRLSNMDRELKEIDQALAEQLSAQNDSDQDMKQHLG
jgi:chromosome segregation ATPase